MSNVRRSLTITEENDKIVQNRRAMFLGFSTPTDIDYTTMVNILIELGDLLFKQKWEAGRVTLNLTDFYRIILKHSENAGLKEESLYDQVQEWFLKNPEKMIDIMQKAKLQNK